MVSQVPALGHCGRQQGCPSIPHFMLCEKEGLGHQGLASSGNSAQRQPLNYCPFPHTHTRFSSTKEVHASSMKSFTFKSIWNPFSWHK